MRSASGPVLLNCPSISCKFWCILHRDCEALLSCFTSASDPVVSMCCRGSAKLWERVSNPSGTAQCQMHHAFFAHDHWSSSWWGCSFNDFVYALPLELRRTGKSHICDADRIITTATCDPVALYVLILTGCKKYVWTLCHGTGCNAILAVKYCQASGMQAVYWQWFCTMDHTTGKLRSWSACRHGEHILAWSTHLELDEGQQPEYSA